MKCPNCQSTEDHYVVWGPRNFRAVVINFLNSYFLLGFWPFISLKRISKPARPLRRVCLDCGYTFMGEQPEPPDFDRCAKCDYNLTGNVSGRCPECGWRLPRRFRAYRRLKDRTIDDRAP
ncbi:MAG: hypothetical protein PVI86_01245 [Phycisphaerae bacterium]|jgi:hypothetical protein